MLVIRDFRVEDMAELERLGLLRENAEGFGTAIASTPAWTGELDGEVIGAAGLIPLDRCRALAWAAFSCHIPRRAWGRILQRIRAQLADAPQDRIEATVPVGFQPGVRFLQRLGFELESKARKFAPEGDHFVFARIREGVR